MNKKILIWIVIIAFSMTACTKQNVVQNNLGRTSEFRKNAPELPYDPISLIEYIEKNKNNVEKEKRKLYLLVLEESLIDNLGLVSSITQNDSVISVFSKFNSKPVVEKDDLKLIDNNVARKELEKLYDMYYKLFIRKNGYVLNIDYEKLVDMSNDIEDLREYFLIKNDENLNPTLDAGEIKLSPSELLSRLNKTESYLLKYPSFNKTSDFLSRYQSWMFLLLSGTNLSPIVKNGELIKEYKNLYESLKPQSIAENTFYRGIDIIKENGFVFDDNTMFRIRNIVNNASYELKVRMENTK